MRIMIPLFCFRYYKWILERNFHDLNKGVRGNQVRDFMMHPGSHVHSYEIVILF